MPIHFEKARWSRIAEDARRWWAGELDRPLIQVRLGGAEAGRREPALPAHGFHSFYELSVPAEDIVDRWDYDISCRRFLGDAFPRVWPNFGAGVLAAFLGAGLENRAETVWFHPPREQDIADVHFEYNDDNVWLRRVRDLMRAALDRWQGNVQLAMTDLGGNLDVLASFRPGERLLLDLDDDPEDVKRVTWEAHEMWWRAFDELDSVLQAGGNPGHTAWTPIFSGPTYYMLQCDFCYMIGPDMFDEFVKPELAACCRRLANPFYHLDGPGALAHLDSLLEIEELGGVQWVPGDGQPDMAHWPHVYRKIRDAGKLVQLFGGPEVLDAVAHQLGSARGIVLITGADASREDEVRRWLESYGVDPGEME